MTTKQPRVGSGPAPTEPPAADGAADPAPTEPPAAVGAADPAPTEPPAAVGGADRGASVGRSPAADRAASGEDPRPRVEDGSVSATALAVADAEAEGANSEGANSEGAKSEEASSGDANPGNADAGDPNREEASGGEAGGKPMRRRSKGPSATEGPDRTGAVKVEAPPSTVDAPQAADVHDPDLQDPQRTDAGNGGRARRKALPTDRPPGAPPDPWTAFATTPEFAPGRLRRARRAVRRVFLHEYALVAYAGLVLAVALTWPTLRYPLHTVPQDIWDPARQAWQIAWSGHILLTDPALLWQSNAFFPERYSFAYGDSLLGYAPAGMVGDGPMAALLRYNILFVLAHALLFIGGYALVRQLGAGRTGSAVAAVAFAYAPWRLTQEGHLDIVSAGGIPLALAMLARGHGWSLRYGFRPDRRHAGWAALGWLVAAWQIGLGFSLGVPFAYVLSAVILILMIAVPIRRWRKPAERPVLGWRVLVADLLGALIVAGVGALIAVPYLRTSNPGSAATEIDFFSPPLRGLLIGPAESRIWGAVHAAPRSSLTWPAEMTLLPGFVLYAIALVGLVFSIWKWWTRLILLVALAATVVLMMGTGFLGGRWTYLPLFGHLPGSFGLRIPGRLMLWVTLLLALLAAGAVAEFVRRAEHLSAHRIPPWPGPWLRLATFVPLVLVLAETWNATPHPVMPDQPAAMRTVSGPMLVLPTAALTDQTTMLWTTSRWQPVANGGGGFAAGRQLRLRQTVATFPDATSVDYLRSLGVTTVLLLRSQVAGTPWERAGDVPVDALGIRREDLDDAVVFRLS